MGDNKSEKFFKVLHDRMKEAQTDIKATVSVNVGEMTHKANERELESGEILLKHTRDVFTLKCYSLVCEASFNNVPSLFNTFHIHPSISLN